MFIVLQLIPNVLNSNLYVYMIPYFILGDFVCGYNQNREIISSIPKNCLILLVVVTSVVYLFLLKFFSYNSYIYTTGTFIGSYPVRQLLTNCYRWIIGLVGIVLILLSSLYLYSFINSHIKCFLAEMVKNSLGIYMISIFLNQYLRILTSSMLDMSYFICILEFLVIMVLSYGITRILATFRITNMLLLGGR